MTNPYANRTVKEQEFESLPDGEYIVDGIEEYFSKDERDLPTFVSQGDTMVARFRYRLADRSKTGPAASASYNQLVMILRALEGDIKNLPADATTAFLLEVQERANKVAGKQTAKVNGGQGWVKYLSGANPEPDKFYTYEFVKATSDDGSEPLRFMEKTFPGKKGGTYTVSIMRFWFRLAGDIYGRPSPFDGYQFNINIEDPFKGEVKKVAAQRWDKFVTLFAPHMNEWEWQTDVEKSKYGMNELDNPVVVFINEALKAKRLVVAQLKLSDKGYAKMDLLDWGESEAKIDDRDQKAEKESSQPWQLAELVELLDDLVEESSGSKAFEPTPKDSDTINLQWTDPGLDWAKANLAILWDEAKLPMVDGKRPLGKLTGGEYALLETVIRKAYGKEKIVKNSALTEEGSF